MRYLVVILVLLFAGSCKKTLFPGEDDELTLEQRPYTGSELRIDGYYYVNAQKGFFNLYCFYENGVLLYIGGDYDSVRIESELEEMMRDGRLHEFTKDNRLRWGLFVINQSKIKFEHLQPRSPGPAVAILSEGEILNDTTFFIRESYRMVDGKKTQITEQNRTYHFKQFSPKPDSTNSFIK